MGDRDGCLNYCGRTVMRDGNLSLCEACPWGYRVVADENNRNSICRLCSTHLTLYDWLYLGFMAILPVLLHSIFIEYCAEKKCTKRILLLQHFCSCLECVCGGVGSVLAMRPMWRLDLVGCGVRGLTDWYTLFFNPTINYTKTMHCTQESVYPLFSLPFIYYAFCLLNLGIMRGLLVCVVGRRRRKTGMGKSVYAALYFYPILTLAHSVLAGLIYYTFPYLLLLGSLFTNAVHFAKYEEQNPKQMNKVPHDLITILCQRKLWLSSRPKARNLCVVLTHCFLYAYCVASFTQFENPTLNGLLMLLIPVPALFYVITVKFSHPKMLSAT